MQLCIQNILLLAVVFIVYLPSSRQAASTSTCEGSDTHSSLKKIEPASNMLRAVSYNVRRFKAVGSGESTVNVRHIMTKVPAVKNPETNARIYRLLIACTLKLWLDWTSTSTYISQAIGDQLAALQPSLVALNEVDVRIRPEALSSLAAKLGAQYEYKFFGKDKRRFRIIPSRLFLFFSSKLTLASWTTPRNINIHICRSREGELWECFD